MELKIVWRNPISLMETKRRCGELEEISWGQCIRSLARISHKSWNWHWA